MCLFFIQKVGIDFKYWWYNSNEEGLVFGVIYPFLFIGEKYENFEN